MKNTLITDLMSDHLLTLHPKDKIQRAKEIFTSYRIHHIPIVVNSTLVGILSLGDILAKENKTHSHMLQVESMKNISMLTIDEVMTQNPISISSTSPIVDGLKIMNTKRINCLPIVDDGQLVGILTSSDVLKFLYEYLK